MIRKLRNQSEVEGIAEVNQQRKAAFDSKKKIGLIFIKHKSLNSLFIEYFLSSQK